MILAIDQGTTGSTCIVFDERGRPVGRAYREFEQHFPRPGWVEHDASEIWDVTRAVAREALDSAGIDGRALAGIGITNQRETVVAWDRDTGEPLHRAIVWQDRRTAARCDELREPGHEPLFRERTGLVLDPYFSGTKIEWLIREGGVPAGAAFGTIDSWLVFKLTGEHVTDFSNASRTLLFDIRERRWDPELCELLGVDPGSLPEACPSAHVYGETSEFGGSVPVAGIAGDQQAALYGQACHEPGLGKNTYGTGSFVLENAGAEAPEPAEGLLTTIAWGVGGRVDYALEAAIFVTGAAVQWLRDQLGIIRTADETEELARSLDSNDGVYMVPAFTGLGSPHWDPYARGTLVGLTRGAGTGAPRPRGARGDGLPDGGRGARDGGGVRRGARGAEGRRRRGGERLADEVPGRRARRAGGGARGLRDDGARRRVSGGRGHGHLERGGRARDVAAGRPLRALDVGGRARGAARGLGASARARRRSNEADRSG